MTNEPTQLDKFKAAARELETAGEPERFKAKMARLVKHNPLGMPENGS
jgi:hypothetical protein